MMGMLGHKLIGLPAPVGMLFLAVLLKLANVVSPRPVSYTHLIRLSCSWRMMRRLST